MKKTDERRLCSGRRRRSPLAVPARPAQIVDPYYDVLRPEQDRLRHVRLEDLPLDPLHDLLLRPRSRSRCRRSPPTPRAPTTTSRAQLNFQIPKPINLIYYATHSDFEQTNTLLNFIPEGVGAFALPSRNRMVLPIDLPDEKLQQLIAHELTHVFQFEILFGGNFIRARRPERAAVVHGGHGLLLRQRRGQQGPDGPARRGPRRPGPGDRRSSGIYGFFAYRFGHAVFDFIEAEWGKDAVRDFVFEFRNQIGAEHRAGPSSAPSTSRPRTSTSSSAGTCGSGT